MDRRRPAWIAAFDEMAPFVQSRHGDCPVSGLGREGGDNPGQPRGPVPPIVSKGPGVSIVSFIGMGRGKAARIARIRSVLDEAWYLERYPEVAAAGMDAAVDYLTRGATGERDPHPLFSGRWYRGGDPAGSHAANPLLAFLECPSGNARDPHPLFDNATYLLDNPDVATSGTNPLVHYIHFGAAERRRTHPLFDPEWYLSQNPGAEGDLLAHYLSGHGHSPHPLFADAWYLEQYPEVAAAGTNPLLDYVTEGYLAGRQPNPLFDGLWYALTSGARFGGRRNPLVHYVLDGAAARLAPHPLFDPDWYGALHPEVKNASLLADFLHRGAAAGETSHILFDAEWYAANNAEAIEAGSGPLLDYLGSGWREGRDPHPLFSISRYLEANPDVAAAGVEPLSHFLRSGPREMRSVHPLFDTAWYLKGNPDVAAAGQNPLVHYLKFGEPEGRNPNPWFATDWYRDQHESLLDGQSPLTHYVTRGAAEERNPSPLFDRDFYLARNQDVLESGLEPLAHFLSSGAAEGRQPRPPDRLSAACEVMDIPLEIWRHPPPLAGREVCLFMTYTPDGRVRDHVLFYLEAIRRQGLTVIIIVATDGLDHPLPPAFDGADGLIVRTNHGWDFAAWAAALTVFPDVWQAQTVILANDSVYGPVDDTALARVIEQVRRSECNLVALTDSHQNWPHLMSYFVGLTRSGLRAEAVRGYWSNVKSIRDKLEVIKAYELTPLAYWRAEGVSFEVLFPTLNDVPKAVNPTLHRWRDLLDRGFPFLKVQLLRDELDEIDPSGWPARLATNPALAEAIEGHLKAVQRGNDRPTFRPVPGPHRRFKRSNALTTFYGATQSLRPTETTDLALEVPFRYPVSGRQASPTIAVIAHIFYPELSNQLLARFRNIPVPADLFVTTDTQAKRQAIAKVFSSYAGGKVEVRVFANVGRDIAPTFVGCRDVFDRYDVFLHVHSKKSPHSGRFADWRGFLLDNLLGSPEIVRSILRLLAIEDVGIVFSQHFPAVRNLLNWGYDFDLAKDLLGRAGATLSRDLVLEFPSSSFFWGRTAAMRPLLDLGLDWADFPPEKGQIDGTIAHAIERSILYVAEHAGYRWAKVAARRSAEPSTTVPVQDDADVERGLLRAHRPLLGNALRPLRERAMFPELICPATRRDGTSRPRLNLILPTLHPKHVFGGISTALRTFEELVRACGDGFDARILCGYVPLDLESMAALPDYELVPGPAVYAPPRRSIVDMTDPDRGEVDVRATDVFVATAWWTAKQAYRFRDRQRTLHGRAHPVIYLIQDHEAGFYPWSDYFGQASGTYTHPEADETIALINSEELATYIQARYAFESAAVVRYRPNAAIRRSLKRCRRERIILIYGRPSTPRNCFTTICDALHRWQQADPIVARDWRVISAGEEYEPVKAGPIQNFEVAGKLTLTEYAELLSRASVGISLMLSPHPSYPPLEMAHAGLRTITNAYENKDLTRRSPNITSVDTLSPEAVAAALGKGVRAAEDRIGKFTPFTEIEPIACDVPDYEVGALAARLGDALACAFGKHETQCTDELGIGGNDKL